MSEHLPPERVSAWVAGERLPCEEGHVRECEGCAAQISKLETAIGAFRASLQAVPAPARWSESQARRRNIWRWTMQAAAAGVAATLLVTAPLVHNARERRRAEQALADARLMEQVERQISRQAPASLEPALQLVSWDTPQYASND